MMFASPPDQSAVWSDSGAEGSARFLRRVWVAGVKLAPLLDVADAASSQTLAGASEAAKALRREMHLLLRQISHDYERMHYNTVVSGAMKMLNALEAAAVGHSAADKAVLSESLGLLLRTLYPAAPHIAHAMWHELGYEARLGEIIDAPWPEVDETALAQDEVELMLQVAGKLRGAIRVAAQASREQIEAAALASPEFARFSEGKAAKKVVVVPGRLVNVVV
jgi:leucyl-tRNA synthetase